MSVKVSIITVCLNSKKTIRDTIESVLAQTYTNIEYIIVDGGSNDGTLEIIKEYQPLFCGRLQYISEKDKGIYNAMNKGIRMSSGEVIGIINSDDYYEKEAVERVMQYEWGKEPQVAYGYLRMLGSNGFEKIWTENHERLQSVTIPHPTCFVSRAAYVKYGLFLECFRIAADYELLLRFYQKGVSFIRVPYIQANFRLGGASYGKRKDIEETLVRTMHGAGSVKELVRCALEYFLS